MLLAVVVALEADEGGVLQGATGQAVHGLWFTRWGSVAPEMADRMHGARDGAPFTLSPLMGLPLPCRGEVRVAAGCPAWFRITTLEAQLSERLENVWLPRLPSVVPISGLRWRVVGWTAESKDHTWAGRGDTQALVQSRLLAPMPPSRWRMEFATPTAFRSEVGHLPLPVPNALVGSWMSRWEAFGAVRLPEDLAEGIRRGLAVSGFVLKSVPVRDWRRLVIGCVGELTLRAIHLTPTERAAVDLLAAYAFWAGSGHHTTQGLGMTRLCPFQGGNRHGTAD